MKKSIFFPDPQARRPHHMCPCCGREVYSEEGECLYCNCFPPDGCISA